MKLLQTGELVEKAEKKEEVEEGRERSPSILLMKSCLVF